MTGIEYFSKIILLAGELGIEEGEIAKLKRSWINFQKGHVVIPSRDGEWSPKTRWGARTIPTSKTSARAWDAIRSYFTTYEALNVHRVMVHRIVNRVASRLKLTAKVYPHSLMATAATRVAYRIKNPQVLCDIFGWGQLAIAKYYVRRAVGWQKRNWKGRSERKVNPHHTVKTVTISR